MKPDVMIKVSVQNEPTTTISKTRRKKKRQQVELEENMYTKKLKERASKKARNEKRLRKELSERWGKKEMSHRYQTEAAKSTCRHITRQLKDELFDGILLELNERSRKKSYSEQKRLLRRIVEKRQAQAARRFSGRTFDRFGAFLLKHSIKTSMSAIIRFQKCI